MSYVFRWLVGILGIGLFAAVAIVAVLGGDPATLKSLALAAVWPSGAHDFSKTYASLAIPSIPAADMDSTIVDKLTALEREPCDKTAVMEIGKDLVKKKELLLAAQAYVGFTKSCYQNEYTEREAAILYYQLGDFEKSKDLASDLVRRFPQYDNDWYRKGQSEAALGLRDAALESYATTIALARNQALLRENVFTEMSALYASARRFCEAMAPMEAYVAIKPAERETSRARQIISGYSQQGHCAQAASGSDSFPVLGSGVIQVRATINGVTGTFAVDTGASFVSVTDGFAARANLNGEASGATKAITANGETSVKLSKAASIRLGRLQASNVPVFILGKSLGQLDGLLGRSFLSRFDMTITQTRLSLRPKA